MLPADPELSGAAASLLERAMTPVAITLDLRPASSLGAHPAPHGVRVRTATDIGVMAPVAAPSVAYLEDHHSDAQADSSSNPTVFRDGWIPTSPFYARKVIMPGLAAVLTQLQSAGGESAAGDLGHPNLEPGSSAAGVYSSTPNTASLQVANSGSGELRLPPLVLPSEPARAPSMDRRSIEGLQLTRLTGSAPHRELLSEMGAEEMMEEVCVENSLNIRVNRTAPFYSPIPTVV